jgi:hypothetical protein
MPYSREQWKASKLSANKETSSKLDGLFKKSFITDVHQIDEGVNLFRLLPPHSSEDPSWQPRVVYWLPAMKEERDANGQPTGKFTRGQYPIFDSRVHGGTEKDIVDEFIKYVREKVKKCYSADEAKRILFPITGYRDKSGKWNAGIQATQSYVAYATKGAIVPENVGRLELYRADKEKLEELNFIPYDESEESGPILVDAFSDPDEGVQFTVTRRRTDKGTWERIVKKLEYEPPRQFRTLSAELVGKAVMEWKESQRVPDEVLEKLGELPSLKSLYQNSYKYTDFTRALEALSFLSEKEFPFNIFEEERFQSIVDEIDNYYEKEPFPEKVALKVVTSQTVKETTKPGRVANVAPKKEPEEKKQRADPRLKFSATRTEADIPEGLSKIADLYEKSEEPTKTGLSARERAIENLRRKQSDLPEPEDLPF